MKLVRFDAIFCHVLGEPRIVRVRSQMEDAICSFQHLENLMGDADGIELHKLETCGRGLYQVHLTRHVQLMTDFSSRVTHVVPSDVVIGKCYIKNVLPF